MERLSRKKLGQFDLEKCLEKELIKNNQEQLFDFQKIIYELYTVDQFIKDCPSYPNSTKKIIRSELISAIGATLAIEGIILREEEIEETLEKADLQKKLKNKEQEAKNTEEAYKNIIDLVTDCEGEFVYSEKHIKKIHKILTDNVESVSPNVPGQYRDTTAMFGYPPKISFYKSKTEITGIMAKFIEWLNEKDQGLLSGNPIVKAMMAHYYFTEIHPFGDGNGRTARALEALVLYVNNINRYCFWSLARFWGADRNKYIIQLGNIRSTCNPLDFLIWGIKGYLEEVKRVKTLVLKKVKKLMLQDYVQWLRRNKKLHPRISHVLMLLITLGRVPFGRFLRSPELATLYAGRKERTRYRDFKIMEDLRLIRFVKENGKKFVEPNFEKLEELQYFL